MFPFESLVSRVFGKSVKRLRAELAEAEARLAGGPAQAEAEARFARGEVDELPPLRSLDQLRPLAMELVKCRNALWARLSRRELEASLAELRAELARLTARVGPLDDSDLGVDGRERRRLDLRIHELESYLKFDHDWVRKPFSLPDLLTMLGLMGAAFVVVVAIDWVMTWMAANP